jgi:hypothetical protein
VPDGQNSFVKLGRRGSWLVDHATTCAHSDDDRPAERFCGWLMENTSTEFMESTVTLAVACVQGQRVVGGTGDTGIASWEGKLRSFAPRFSDSDRSVDLSWQLVAGEVWDDYIRIQVVPD